MGLKAWGSLKNVPLTGGHTSLAFRGGACYIQKWKLILCRRWRTGTFPRIILRIFGPFPRCVSLRTVYQAQKRALSHPETLA